MVSTSATMTLFMASPGSCTIPARSAKSRGAVHVASKGNVFAYGYDRESSNYSRDFSRSTFALSSQRSEGQENLDPRPFDGQLGDARSVAANGDPRWTRRRQDQTGPPRGSRRRCRRLPRTDRGDGTDRPHIALFVSEDDQALAASKEVWGAPRLGAINPNIEPYKSMLEREISPSSTSPNYPHTTNSITAIR